MIETIDTQPQHTQSQVGAYVPDNWDSFVAHHPSAHFLQTSQWGELKSHFGWRSEQVILRDSKGVIESGTLMLYRRTAGLTIAYIPRGPLVNWSDHVATHALLTRIEAHSRRQGASVLKIEPSLLDTPENRDRLRRYGFRPSPQTVQPPSTMVIDITGDEDAILKRMKSKWRYNIRLAKRKGVKVHEGGRADLAHFNELMQTTGQRNEFYVHSPAYYERAFDLFVPEYGTFLFAEYEGQPLAAIVVFAIGKTAWYPWGASSNRERNRMPNHALYWAAMRWARQRGAERYDLWGIPDELGKVAVGMNGYLNSTNGHEGIPATDLPLDLKKMPTDGELWGVYRLKQGFGGNVVRYVGAWDKPISEIGYKLYTTGLTVRKKLPEIKEQILDIRDSVFPANSPNPQSPIPNPQPITQAQEWRTILSTLPNPHFLQSWEWGHIKAQTDWVAERYVVSMAGDSNQTRKVQGAFQFLWRQPISGVPLRIAYIPKGPILDWGDGQAVEKTLAAIEQIAKAKSCIFVKIDPDVRQDMAVGKELIRQLHKRDWQFSQDQIQFKNTAFSDLTSGAEALLAAMKSKWRYNIRLAQRRGIQIRSGNEGDFNDFYALYTETGQRDGFLIRTFDYYRTTWHTFLKAQQDAHNPAGGCLFLAEHLEDDKAVAGIFVVRYGNRAWYFYGASSARRRRDMPNYLLQWEALKWAIDQGCTVYDWWGAPTVLKDENDSLQGIWRFKQGFGAEFQLHVGAWDWPVIPPVYRLYTELMPKLLELMKRLQ